MKKIAFCLLVFGVSVAVARTGECRFSPLKAHFNQVSDAMALFYLNIGRFPTEKEGLSALMNRPATVSPEHWNGPYLNKWPKDPWGNDYVYVFPRQDDKNRFGVYSMGPDGKSVSSGNDDDDYNNWDPKSPRVVPPRPLTQRVNKDLLFYSAVILGIVVFAIIGTIISRKRKGPNNAINTDR